MAAGENLAEVKVMSQFKVHASLSEYYVDRVTVGLPASVTYQGKRYALKVSKVVPEVKDRTFDVDLVFTGEMPENVRLGKSFRVQIELGQPEQALVIPRGNFYSQTVSGFTNSMPTRPGRERFRWSSGARTPCNTKSPKVCSPAIG